MDARALIQGIAGYVESAFQDAPSGVKADKQEFYSWFAGACDLFASEYGWTPQQIIDMPVKQIFQLSKAMRERKNPECHLFKPSDRIIGQWLDEQNRLLATN